MCVVNVKCGGQEEEHMLTSSEAGSGQVSMATSTVHPLTILADQLIPNHCTRLPYHVHLCDSLICSIHYFQPFHRDCVLNVGVGVVGGGQ